MAGGGSRRSSSRREPSAAQEYGALHSGLAESELGGYQVVPEGRPSVQVRPIRPWQYPLVVSAVADGQGWMPGTVHAEQDRVPRAAVG